jgi:hypothetical protein
MGYYFFGMIEPRLSILIADITVQMIGGWLAAVFAGGGVLWVLFLLMIRGFWDKTGKPAVRELLVSLYAEPENVKKRTEEIQGVIQMWHNAPEQIKTRTDFVRSVIDNEVRRDDGLIHKGIMMKADALKADLAEKIDDVATKLDKFREAQELRDKETREFNSQVLAKLARIEGAFSTITGRNFGTSSTSTSYTNLPAQRSSKSVGGGSSSDG